MGNQPRYAAYLKTTTDPTNWGFMCFIGKMKRAFFESIGSKEDYKGILCDIPDHNAFTKFIQERVND